MQHYANLFFSSFNVDFGSVRFRLSAHRVPVPVHLPPVSDGPLPALGPLLDCPQVKEDEPLRQ